MKIRVGDKWYLYKKRQLWPWYELVNHSSGNPIFPLYLKKRTVGDVKNNVLATLNYKLSVPLELVMIIPCQCSELNWFIQDRQSYSSKLVGYSVNIYTNVSSGGALHQCLCAGRGGMSRGNRTRSRRRLKWGPRYERWSSRRVGGSCCHSRSWQDCWPSVCAKQKWQKTTQ